MKWQWVIFTNSQLSVDLLAWSQSSGLTTRTPPLGVVRGLRPGLLSDNSELYPAQPGILLDTSPASILDKAVATIHPIHPTIRQSVGSWDSLAVLLATCGFGLSQCIISTWYSVIDRLCASPIAKGGATGCPGTSAFSYTAVVVPWVVPYPSAVSSENSAPERFPLAEYSHTEHSNHVH